MNNKQRFLLVLPLIIASIIAILTNRFFDYDGLLVNLGTEIIGIVATILYVDVIFYKHKNRNWEAVSIKMKEELCSTSNTIISSLRLAIGYTHNDLVYPGNLYTTVKKDIVEQSLEIIDGYKRNILPKLKNEVYKMKQKDWDVLISNLSNMHNACINYQSMYNAISSPAQIETLMNITSFTFSIISQYRTFFDVYSTDDDELRNQTGNDERVDIKYWLHQTFCNDFNKLVDILYNNIVNDKVKN